MSERENHQLAAEVPARDGNPLSLSERVRSLRLPDKPSRERSGGSVLPWLLCLVLAGSSAYLGYIAYGKPQAEGEPGTSAARPAAGAPAAETAGAGDVVLESKGYIIPAHQILVSPKVGGMIEKLNFIEGDQVKKGTELAVIESIEYQADFERARAALVNAERRLEEVRVSLPLQIEEARSSVAMLESQKSYFISEASSTLSARQGATEMQRTKANSDLRQIEASITKERNMLKRLEDTAAVRIGTLDADVKQAQAELAKARWRLDNCIVRAPVSGTILKKNAEEGNLVNAVAFNGSFSLCDMADLSDLEVELSIQERDISRVFAEQECRIRAEAYPKREYAGKVSRLMPIADRAKGAVPVRVKLTVPRNEEGKYLKPEMGAVVSFLKGSDR